MKIKFKKKKEDARNEIFEFNENDYVSFNPSIGGSVYNSFGQMLGLNNQVGKPETALYLESKWYILNGDFRQDIMKCNTIESVKELFIELYNNYGSNWSTFNLN